MNVKEWNCRNKIKKTVYGNLKFDEKTSIENARNECIKKFNKCDMEYCEATPSIIPLNMKATRTLSKWDCIFPPKPQEAQETKFTPMKTVSINFGHNANSAMWYCNQTLESCEYKCGVVRHKESLIVDRRFKREPEL